MAIVIKKKRGVNADPVAQKTEEVVFVPGYTAEESRKIVEDVLDRWIISLAKRQAQADYARALQGGSQ